MANKKTTSNFIAHMFLPTTKEINNSNNIYEFEESDIWNSEFPSSETKKKFVPSSSRYHCSKKNINTNKMMGRSSTSATSSSRTCSSLPVNVPDWSEIYKEKSKSKEESYTGEEDTNNYTDKVSEEEDREEGFRVPPHEYLARQRGASFSVHEGRGRTLKGRDLRQVRNAIWKKIGFED